MVDKRTITKLEEKLKEEMATLGQELGDIGAENYMNPSDWHGTNGDLETGTADASILADRFEAKTTNESIVNELEERYKHIQEALDRIKKGTYGVCEKCDTKIPTPRLEANPAATTCIDCAD